MNFATVGDKVRHPELGHGTVVKLLGQNQDDGVKVKLDDGKVIKVSYDEAGKDFSGGWRLITRGKGKAAVYRKEDDACRAAADKLIEDFEAITEESAIESIYSNLLNGNLLDAKRQALRYSRKALYTGFTEIGVDEDVANAAAIYLKQPSQATFQAYADAEANKNNSAGTFMR